MLNPKQNAMIGLLLSSFPNFQSGDAESALTAYELAVSDYTGEDMADAVKAFIQGRVPGHNMAFAPTAPQLASACRRAMDARLDDMRRHRSAVLQIEARDEADTPKNAEMRARVAAMVASAVKNLTIRDAAVEEDEAARASYLKRHDDRFHGVSYTVGDADADDGDMGQRAAS